MELHIFGIGILTWMVFLPVLGMLIILMLPGTQHTADSRHRRRRHRYSGGAGRRHLLPTSIAP